MVGVTGDPFDDGRERCRSCWSDNLRVAGADTALCLDCHVAMRRDCRTGEYVRMATLYGGSRKPITGRRPRR